MHGNFDKKQNFLIEQRTQILKTFLTSWGKFWLCPSKILINFDGLQTFLIGPSKIGKVNFFFLIEPVKNGVTSFNKLSRPPVASAHIQLTSYSTVLCMPLLSPSSSSINLTCLFLVFLQFLSLLNSIFRRPILANSVWNSSQKIVNSHLLMARCLSSS